MASWFFPARTTEASLERLVVSGAAGGQYGVDPVDGDSGYTRVGGGSREVPVWTLEKQRAYSVAAYRINPLARAIIDTYVSFCVGDSGISINCTNPDVATIVEEFTTDPRVRLREIQELLLRDHMLQGETALELMVGPLSGRTRFSPITPSRISNVTLLGGNPLWPDELIITNTGVDDTRLKVAAVDDISGLRSGNAMWWPSWKATIDDRRGQPFLGPILDWLDSYDDVLSNLVDRTALARYLVWDVTVKDSGPDAVKKFLKDRGGNHMPRSGSIEVHNESVEWEPKSAPSGAAEDTMAGQAIMTSVAAGAGLAKTWLAEPDGANRATSLTMAEPVRRRVGGVQNLWLAYQTDLVRFVVDQAVAARRIPAKVPSTDKRTATAVDVPAALAVQVTGPEIAAADAQVTAQILVNLGTGIDKLIKAGVLTERAGQVLTKKAWEQFAGVPYTADLDRPAANPDDIATAIDDATAGTSSSATPLRSAV